MGAFSVLLFAAGAILTADGRTVIERERTGCV
jgi:hypothetical protein